MAEDEDMRGQIEPDWKKKFNTCDIKVQVKTITDKAFENFTYNPEEVQANSEKANSLAIKIRDVIQRKVENMKIMGENWNHKPQNHPVFGFSKLLYCYIVTLLQVPHSFSLLSQQLAKVVFLL